MGPQGVLDTNMLVSPTQHFRLGGLDQREAPTQSGSRCGEIKCKQYLNALNVKYFVLFAQI